MAGFVMEHMRTFCVKQMSFSVSCAFSVTMLMSCRYRGQWSFRSTYDVRLFETDILLYVGCRSDKCTDSVVVAKPYNTNVTQAHLHLLHTRYLTLLCAVAIAIHGQHTCSRAPDRFQASPALSARSGYLSRSFEACIPGPYLLCMRNADRPSSVLPHCRDLRSKVLCRMLVLVESNACHGSTCGSNLQIRLLVFDVDDCLYRRSSYLLNFSKTSSS